MKKRPARRQPLSIHFQDEGERRQLEMLAKQDGRSISNLVQKFIREGMARIGAQPVGSNG
ncbi:MAG: hypothetical protein HY847_13040 [Betaproteobacteria bacterium]|nr:hypothetical protein [Betaproteobacteria bacterium]